MFVYFCFLNERFHKIHFKTKEFNEIKYEKFKVLFKLKLNYIYINITWNALIIIIIKESIFKFSFIVV